MKIASSSSPACGYHRWSERRYVYNWAFDENASQNEVSETKRFPLNDFWEKKRKKNLQVPLYVFFSSTLFSPLFPLFFYHFKKVYARTTASLVSSVWDGFNATVFAYGATGAGKTCTMIGTEDIGPGVMVQVFFMKLLNHNYLSMIFFMVFTFGREFLCIWLARSNRTKLWVSNLMFFLLFTMLILGCEWYFS